MAEYKVLIAFADLEDGNYIYRAGDTYPRPGITVGEARIEELASSENKQNRPLIEKVSEVEKEEPIVDPVEIQQEPIEVEVVEEPVEQPVEQEEKPVEKKPRKKATKKKE